jgi:hypothetical protein
MKWQKLTNALLDSGADWLGDWFFIGPAGSRPDIVTYERREWSEYQHQFIGLRGAVDTITRAHLEDLVLYVAPLNAPQFVPAQPADGVTTGGGVMSAVFPTNGS